MTTAHRPTFNAAAGSKDQGGNKSYVPSRQYSSRDLPGQLSMKERPQGEVQGRDFRAELLEREAKLRATGGKEDAGKRALVDADDDQSLEPSLRKQVKLQTKEVVVEEKESKESYINPFPQDADDDDFLASDDDEDKSEKKSSESEEDEESDDDKLFEEYERIKREREEEQKKKNQEQEEELRQQREEELMNSNPLLDGSGYSLQKKWFEDTVFKNQAKTEPKEKQRFINDTVRSDFHKKFLSKYIFT